MPNRRESWADHVEGSAKSPTRYCARCMRVVEVEVVEEGAPKRLVKATEKCKVCGKVVWQEERVSGAVNRS